MTGFDQFVQWSPLVKEGALFALSAAAGMSYWIRTRRAQSWPLTQGTLWQSNVRIQDKSWVGELIYSYKVEGEYYSGTHLLKARSEKKAEALVEAWKGRMLLVRYAPTQPDVSVLLKGDQAGLQLNI
jgi:hypothetical protein